MKFIIHKQLTCRDHQIADIVVGDQILLFHRAVVAQYLPPNATLLCVNRNGEDSELWVRGRKADAELVRMFFLGWRSALRNATVFPPETA